jgi:hypothetical protein
VNRRLVHSGRAAGLRGTAVAIGTALVLAGCSGGSSTADPVTSSPPVAATTQAAATSSTTTPATPTTPAATPSTSPPTALGQVITVAFAQGKVVGPSGRVKVKKNSTVAISVTSDVADEVHLHGYDKSVDVAAGGTVVLSFKATLTGVFEVELEGKKQSLLKLQVS